MNILDRIKGEIELLSENDFIQLKLVVGERLERKEQENRRMLSWMKGRGVRV